LRSVELGEIDVPPHSKHSAVFYSPIT
jgi:hypothetical protein